MALPPFRDHVTTNKDHQTGNDSGAALSSGTQ